MGQALDPLFPGRRDSRDLGAAEVEAFLSHLAVDRHVAAATQNQAKAALLFLYKEVLGTALPWLDEIVQARVTRRLPVVLTSREVKALLDELDGTLWLFVALLYGTGMRLLEGLRLRAKDVDLERRAIVVREGKGAKDRVPEHLVLPLRDHWLAARALHQDDLAAGYGDVEMPHALDVKYPKAGTQWQWQFVSGREPLRRSAQRRDPAPSSVSPRPCNAPSRPLPRALRSTSR